mmetsp:Transcript_60054/g.143027  ORF Transcript_60054/g.143027 Transcript_60054/m.143027 type:complete len:493 (-) Transcript_60054:42-1520(-)
MLSKLHRHPHAVLSLALRRSCHAAAAGQGGAGTLAVGLTVSSREAELRRSDSKVHWEPAVATAAEAGSCLVLTGALGLVCVAGVASAFLFPRRSEAIAMFDAPDLAVDKKGHNMIQFRAAGGVQLRLRGADAGWSAQQRLKSTQLDITATKLLGNRFAPQMERVALAAPVTEKLLQIAGSSADLASKAAAVKITEPWPQAAVQNTLVVDIRPGVGLLDLYGSPDSYQVQQDSMLRSAEASKGGTYSARDFFSSRPDRVRSAVAALLRSPAGADARWSMTVMEGDKGHRSAASDSPEVASARLGRIGLADVDSLVDVLCMALRSAQGCELLQTLLRAQCGAGSSGGQLQGFARDLRSAMRERAGLADEEMSIPSADIVSAAFARGFWTLSADESGMHWREREGERLLERTRRELWTAGSVSRQELEMEVRKFLFRYQLGRAAAQSWLRIWLVHEPDPESSKAQSLESMGYERLDPALGLWCKCEIDLLALPLD